MSELTVEKIKSYVDEFVGLSSLGDRLMMDLPPEHNDVIVHAPVEIYKYLLDKLSTIELDTAVKCGEIADECFNHTNPAMCSYEYNYDVGLSIRTKFNFIGDE